MSAKQVNIIKDLGGYLSLYYFFAYLEIIKSFYWNLEFLLAGCSITVNYIHDINVSSSVYEALGQWRRGLS